MLSNVFIKDQGQTVALNIFTFESNGFVYCVYVLGQDLHFLLLLNNIPLIELGGIKLYLFHILAIVMMVNQSHRHDTVHSSGNKWC